MNWTGGRLQRHSKANANPALKKQRHYFAKARLRLQNGNAPPSPPSLSIFKGFDPAVPTIDPDNIHNNEPPERIATDNKGVDRPHTRDRDPRERQPSPQHSQCAEPQLDPVPPGDPLIDLKRRLLQKTDWVGLAATKPAQIRFQPAEEMERIGRRRKVTKQEPKQRAPQTHRLQPHHNIIQPFRHRDSQSVQPCLNEKEYSIRIGSNIHQTQTTKESFQQSIRSPLSQSTHPDSMLLDKLDVPLIPTRVPRQELRKDEVLRVKSVSSGLISLKDARNMKTFDEVLHRSSSQVREMPSVRTGKVADDSLMASTTKLHQQGSDSDLMPGPRLLADTPSLPSMPQLQEHLASRIRQTSSEQTSQLNVAEPGQVTSARLAFSGSRRQAHRFTLDEQASAEQEVDISSDPPLEVSGRRSPIRSKQYEQQRLLSDQVWKANAPLNDVATLSTISSDHYTQKRHDGHDVRPPTFDINHRQAFDREDSSFGGRNTRTSQPNMNWRSRFERAKTEHQRDVAKEGTPYGLPQGSTQAMSDENEAWMKYVFPKDFGRIQTTFSFAKPGPKAPSSRASFTSWQNTGSQVAISSHPAIFQYSPPKPHVARSQMSIATAANATMFSPSQAPATGTSETETDFLSRFSPMEGVIDERLADGSVYNNPARTEKSWATLQIDGKPAHSRPHMSAYTQTIDRATGKRTALEAFNEEAMSRGAAYLPTWNRQPLHPITQPRLWSSDNASDSSHQAEAQIEGQYHRTPYQQYSPLRSHLPLASSANSSAASSSQRQRSVPFPMGYSPTSVSVANRKMQPPSRRLPASGPFSDQSTTGAKSQTMNDRKYGGGNLSI